MAAGASNVWTQMNYVPPRGQCNHKASILAAKCSCLRFMLHPLKFSSSYECDGCAHHASFHNMENKAEDEIRRRWEQETKDRAGQREDGQPRPKKRMRAIEFGRENGAPEDATKSHGGAGKKTARAASTKAKTRITETVDEEDVVVELD